MNYARIALAALAAAVVDAVYGFLVYGNALAGQFSQFSAVYRPPSDTSHMPVLLAGIVVGAVAASYIYAKGYEGGGGAAEGIRFGVAMGVFVGGYVTLISWAVTNIGRRLAMSLAVAGFVEWVIVGL